MYCKNCGQPIDEKAFLCMKCGYRNGDGDKFCHNCGKDVSPGQSLCLNCGFMLNDDIEEPQSKTKKKSSVKGDKPYLVYTDKVKKINILSLIMEILVITIAISIIFVPIHKYEYGPQSLEELEGITAEEWITALKGEPVERTYSMLSDFAECLASTQNGRKTNSITDKNIMIYIPILLQCIGLCFCIAVIIRSTISIIKLSKLFQDPNRAAMLQYNKITNDNGRTNMLYTPALGKNMLLLAFSLIYYWLLAFIIPSSALAETIPSQLKGQIPFFSFSGISLWIIVPIVLVVGSIIINIIRKNKEDAMTLEITSQEYN